MGKLHLTREELDKFPTMEDIILRSEGKDQYTWGMCQNSSGDITFGEECPGWNLVVSLNEILEDMAIVYGEDIALNDIVLIYGSAYSRDEDSYDVDYDFIELSSYDDMVNGSLFLEYNTYRDPRN